MTLSPLMAAVHSHDDLARNWYRHAMHEHSQLPADRAAAVPPRTLFAWGWLVGSELPVLTCRLRPISFSGGGVTQAITAAARLLLIAAGCTSAIISTSLFSAHTELDGRDRPWTAATLTEALGQYPDGAAGIALWTYGVNLAGDLYRKGTWMTPTGGYDLNREPRYAMDQHLIRDGLVGAGLGAARPLAADLAAAFTEPLTYPQQQALNLLGAGLLLDVRFQGHSTVRAPMWAGGSPPTREWMTNATARIRPRLAELVDRYL